MRGSFVAAAALLASAGIAAGQNFSDNFDSYVTGTDIVGQGGWEIWYTGGTHADISTDFASSGTKSLKLAAFSDIVQRFTKDHGVWNWSSDIYVPSAGTANGYLILMNQYQAVNNWSCQVGLDPTTGLVTSDFGGESTALIADRFVTMKCRINLDTDLMDIYYDGVLLAGGLVWTNNVSGGGITSIGCCDLYSNGMDPMYFDTVSLKCAADFNDDNSVDFFDYDDFVGCFEDSGCANGDFNGDGSVDFFDYDDFVAAFESGCE